MILNAFIFCLIISSDEVTQNQNLSSIYFMTQYKQKKKSLTEYDELKDKRQKDLMNELEEYLIKLKKQAVNKDYIYCEEKANKSGEYDQIQEKLCHRNRLKLFKNVVVRILPQLSQHSFNYQQCMKQCQKNNISYVVANQSCRGVYQKNFVKSTQSVAKRLKDQGII